MRVEDDHTKAEEFMNPPGEAVRSAGGISGMSNKNMGTGSLEMMVVLRSGKTGLCFVLGKTGLF